jgi:cell wall assembly regulator SMI1
MKIKKYLHQISRKAIEINPENYSDTEKNEKWIGVKPATDVAIQTTQKRLGTYLPQDVIELYKTTNGTSEILTQTFGGFDPIEKIEWLKNLQPETIEAYSEMGEEYVKTLSNSIVIAGANHPHMVLIIQPNEKHKKWRYWEFAHFIPGENEFLGIEKYLDRLNDFLEEQIKNKADSELLKDN